MLAGAESDSGADAQADNSIALARLTMILCMQMSWQDVINA
jgi:hypothetical protein